MDTMTVSLVLRIARLRRAAVTDGRLPLARTAAIAMAALMGRRNHASDGALRIVGRVLAAEGDEANGALVAAAVKP
jgi:hypothetical protein